MRNLLLLLAVAALPGCAFFEALIAAFNAAAQEPKLAFSENSMNEPASTVSVAALQPDDRALVVRRFDDFLAPGPVYGIFLSPDDTYLALNHVEEGFVIEGRTFIYDISSGELVDFQTDNTIADEIDAQCGMGAIVQPFVDAIPTEIANGNLPPNTTGAFLSYVDEPINEIRFQRWLDAETLALFGHIEMALTYTTDGDDFPVGPVGTFDLYMTFAPDGDDWGVGSCSATESDAPDIPTTRDLTIGPAPDRELLLDGAVLLDLNDEPVAPDGAVRVSGPYQ